MQPEQQLPLEAPARLKKFPIAAATWRRLMRIYAGLDAEIVSKLDFDLLTDYCILTEQLSEMDELRKNSMELWRELDKARLKLLEEEKFEEAIEMTVRTSETFERIVKLDARVDRKRALLDSKRQSLYLTPRSRAGVAPNKKEEEPAQDPMDVLLGNVNDFVNGGK